MLPPRLVRRLVLAPLMVVLAAALAILFPLLAPMDQLVVAKWWRVPVGDVPRGADHESQVKWLYDWWQLIDAWITANRPEDVTFPALSPRPAAD